MTTISTQLADALRAVLSDNLREMLGDRESTITPDSADAAREALAAYDAQQMAEQVKLSNEIIDEVIAEERAAACVSG